MEFIILVLNSHTIAFPRNSLLGRVQSRPTLRYPLILVRMVIFCTTDEHTADVSHGIGRVATGGDILTDCDILPADITPRKLLLLGESA